MADLIDILMRNALEASLLAVVVDLVLKARRCRPSTQHLLWLLVLVKLLMPPLALHSFGLSGACAKALGMLQGREARRASRTPAARETAAVIETALVRPEESPDAVETCPSPEWGRTVPRVTAEALGEVVTAEILAAGPPSDASPREVNGALDVATATAPEPPRAAPAVPAPPALPSAGSSVYGDLFALWLSGAIVLALWQALRIALLQIRLRQAKPAPPHLASEASRLCERLGIRRPPRVAVLPGLTSPMVWALGRPAVVFPSACAASSRKDDFTGVLAHELAHIKRLDHWTCWIELTSGWLYWWLPTYWCSCRQLREASDQAADTWAVWAVGSRTAYAEALLRTMETLREYTPSIPPLARGVGQRETIARRLTMIMREPVRPRLSRSAVFTMLWIALLVLPAAPRGWLGRSLASSGEPQNRAPEGVTPPASPENLGGPAPLQSEPELPPAVPVPSLQEVGGNASGPEGLQPTRGDPRRMEQRLRRLEESLQLLLTELRELRRGAKKKAKSPSVLLPGAEPPGGVYEPGEPALPEESQAVPAPIPPTPRGVNPPAPARSNALPSTILPVQESPIGFGPSPRPALSSSWGPRLDLVQLASTLADASGRWKMAKLKYQRTASLAKGNAVSQYERDVAKIEFETAENKVQMLQRMAEAALRATMAELDRLSVERERSVLLGSRGESKRASIESQRAAVEANAEILKTILSSSR